MDFRRKAQKKWPAIKRKTCQQFNTEIASLCKYSFTDSFHIRKFRLYSDVHTHTHTYTTQNVRSYKRSNKYKKSVFWLGLNWILNHFSILSAIGWTIEIDSIATSVLQLLTNNVETHEHYFILALMNSALVATPKFDGKWNKFMMQEPFILTFQPPNAWIFHFLGTFVQNDFVIHHSVRAHNVSVHLKNHLLIIFIDSLWVWHVFKCHAK